MVLQIFILIPVFLIDTLGTLLVFHWLRLHFTAGGAGLIPSLGTKILYAAWHYQKKKKDTLVYVFMKRTVNSMFTVYSSHLQFTFTVRVGPACISQLYHSPVEENRQFGM